MSECPEHQERLCIIPNRSPPEHKNTENAFALQAQHSNNATPPSPSHAKRAHQHCDKTPLSTIAMPPPHPLVFPPSQRWHGHDGHWSTFIVRAGTPEQNFHVLPSAATGELILPHALGCPPTNTTRPDCAELRGVFDSNHQPGFVPNASTSWKQEGFFEVGLEARLGYVDDGLYGTDSVGLMIQNSGGPTLKEQVVGAVRQMPFFVGFFGLSPLASNFTDFDQPQRSLLTALRDEGHIPSLSFAYNAGAYYSTF
ncbi:hypothetical protein OPT61_g8689 [Boeremia exigua]|uniref:Uncharacterized protein n=1 Tax=Boeremia exigua TaxID=749465 RepID=A0ACC2HYW5_9PLEO|nr:hypothetical protein OPT61_g8689 [Boeremia exigua]